MSSRPVHFARLACASLDGQPSGLELTAFSLHPSTFHLTWPRFLAAAAAAAVHKNSASVRQHLGLHAALVRLRSVVETEAAAFEL